MKKNESAWPAGVKKTKQRACVLALLEAAETPLSAAELFLRARQGGDASLSLSTVYRILDHFVEKGLAAKTAVLDGGTALYALDRHQHRHYAVCVSCRRVVALESCPMEALTPELSENGFHVLGHRVELYGYCGDCDIKRAGARK